MDSDLLVRSSEILLKNTLAIELKNAIITLVVSNDGKIADVAQLDRALDYESRGFRFDPRHLHLKNHSIHWVVFLYSFK